MRTLVITTVLSLLLVLSVNANLISKGVREIAEAIAKKGGKEVAEEFVEFGGKKALIDSRSPSQRSSPCSQSSLDAGAL